jgi:crotonobetainyl-CoA:carnitine CoA-transferase CaiB-like acyl-CoA transferase
MGAEVIKVEDKGAGDYARNFFQTPEEEKSQTPSVFYRSINHNKQVVFLDLKIDQDKNEFLKLVKSSDLVIESFRPGVMQRLGIGHEQLLKLKPSLVYCAITGYGMTGSWKNQACHDINSLALTGVLDQMRDLDGRPIMPNIQIADVLGGAVSAAMGCLAALWQSQRSGQGSVVDISMTDGVLAHNVTAQVAVHHSGSAPGPTEDLLNGGVPCYNLYQCKGGQWIALGALELKFWEIFCSTAGKPEWAGLHWSLGQAIGGPEALGLRDKVQALIQTQNRADWERQFSGVDCCFTPVLSLDETMRHPLFGERAMVQADTDGKPWIQSPVRFF